METENKKPKKVGMHLTCWSLGMTQRYLCCVCLYSFGVRMKTEFDAIRRGRKVNVLRLAEGHPLDINERFRESRI